MLKGALFAVISSIMYSTLPVFGKIGYQLNLEPQQMLLCRFGFGTVILLCFLALFNRKTLKADMKLHIKAAGLGICLYVPQSFFLLYSLKYIPASTSSLVLYLYPLTVLIFSTLIFKEPFHKRYLLAVLFILAGCSLVFYDAFLRSIDFTGIAIVFCATVIFSFYLIFSQKVLKDERPITVTLYLMMYSTIGFLLTQNPAPLFRLDLSQYALLAGFGLITSVLAITFLYMSIKIIGAPLASIFSSFEPVFTVLLAYFILSEQTALIQYAGAVLIVLGVITPNIKKLNKNN